MDNVKSKISIVICYITITAYILFGNCLTFNIGNRMPIKIAEVISILTILILLILKTKIKISKFDSNMIVCLGFGIFSLFFNGIISNYKSQDMLYALLYPARIITLMVLTNLIAECFSNNNINKKKIIDYIIVNYIIVCIIGFIQLRFYPKAYDFYDIFYNFGVYFPNPDPHNGRLISTYFDPNYLAQCLSIPFIFSIIYWIKYAQKRYIFSSVILLISIIKTISRSGFLVLMICSLIIFIIYVCNKKTSLKTIKIYFILFCVFIMILVLGETNVINRIFNTIGDPSAIARVDSWKNSLDIIRNNSVIGIGYNMTGFYNNLQGSSIQFGNDSSLLLVIITSGAIGTLLFIKMIYEYIKSQKLYGIEGKAICAIIISALIGCNFINLLFYILWLFPIMLITNVVIKSEENENERMH